MQEARIATQDFLLGPVLYAIFLIFSTRMSTWDLVCPKVRVTKQPTGDTDTHPPTYTHTQTHKHTHTRRNAVALKTRRLQDLRAEREDHGHAPGRKKTLKGETELV